MHNNKVSVIIPVYNVEKYIDKCMESLLNQTYTNIEVILINDGSTDASGAKCDNYRLLDSRVVVIHKENGGVSSARNLGLAKASGDYITFVDPDDWVERNIYETMVASFGNNVDAVFCGYWEDPEKETGLTPILHQPEKSGTVNGEEALYQCLIGMGYGYFTAVWNKMFKATFLKDANIEFEKYSIAEDELWLAKTVPLCNAVKLIPSPFYHWRQSADSALRGVGNYTKWYSALEAKAEVVATVENFSELKNLSSAKVYNDIFDITWRAYIAGDKHISKDFIKKLAPYKTYFLKSKYFSKMKKIKFLLIEILIICNFPKKALLKIGTTTKYRLKEKLNGL